MPSRAAVAAALLCCVGTLLSVPRLPVVGTAQALPPQPQPSGGGGEECARTCGDVSIPYPFGFGPDHCFRLGFELECRAIEDGVQKPFRGSVEVLGISLHTGQARVMHFISSYCYDTELRPVIDVRYHWKLSGTPYAFSDPGNRFIVIGCRTLAYIEDRRIGNDVKNYMTGCVSFWPDVGTTYAVAGAATNDSCSGMGCCQTAIPMGLQYYRVSFDERFRFLSSEMHASCNCSYAVLMDSSNFTFSPSYLTSTEFNDTYNGRAPVLLQWSIGKNNCDAARTEEDFACVSDNSECFDAPRGQGYICNCSKGFDGNPYLRGDQGCKDIDECMHPKEHSCYGKCTNEPGSFKCVCPVGSHGNPNVDGSCQRELLSSPVVRLGIGIFSAVLVVLFCFLGREVVVQKRNSRRQAYFQEHGGQMLLRILQRDGNTTFSFYNREDIVKATGNFRKANIVGQGAHGTVYKAILDVSGTATAVAVKRCNEIDKTKTKEFVQELVVLCSVRHPNVVKLLGCCLQFEAPMLVYEFVQNGTLRHLLHGRPRRRPLALATRLKIATDSAVALAHLHSCAILHGDVKPENILLGDGLLAKVSDFGCSTINDNIQVIPKGTLAYLDPEFLSDSSLTDKNDVYSFGVVLMELLTGKKPVVKDRKNLTLLFQQSLVAGTLGDVLDADIEVDEVSMVVINQTARLASQCIMVPGETRPRMEQVAVELRGLFGQVLSRSSQAQEEIEGLGRVELRDEMIPTGYTYTTATPNLSTQFHGSVNIAALSTELAR